MTEIDIPVLIVGAGPIGLLGARLLARRGVRSLVAEKHPSPLDAPKAHALNPRSLEICAAAGLPMDRIHAAATPAAEGGKVRFVQTLAGPDIGVLPYERQDEAVRAVTPWPLINIAQPALEGVIEAALADDPEAEVRRGLEWLRCEHLADRVLSTLVDRATGDEVKVRSRWLIAADGAGSPVREACGIVMDGPAALQNHVMIHFEADLRPLLGERPAILYFLFGPGPNGVFIAFDLGKTWVLMYPFPPSRSEASFTPEVCRDLVLAAAGAPIPDLQIKGIRFWSMSAQVARRYRSGNVFLAGDAGHRFPPTGGLGLNTGAGDIDNLTWRIAAVEAGWAGPDMLDAYEAERRAIAQTNMGQSLANAMRIRVLFEALGYAPGQAVDAADFGRRLSDPALRAKVDEAVAHQKDHFDSLRLQLGFAYGEALKADDALPISAFTPKAVPGARLPHAALRDGRSTLELVDVAGLTLLCGPEGGAWRSRAAALGTPVSVLVEGVDFTPTDGGWAQRMGLSPNGAILVRPDAHILALASDASAAQALLEAARDCLKPPLEATLEEVA